MDPALSEHYFTAYLWTSCIILLTKFDILRATETEIQ